MAIEYVKVTWKDVEDAFRAVASELKDKYFDCIVCIGRGGMIPSRLMSEYLNIKEIYFIPTHYDKNGNVVINNNIDIDQLDQKSVLVVDEVYTTGKSITAIYNYIFDNIEEVEVTNCVGWFNEKSKNKPDVWGKLYNGETQWLIFPWEYTLNGEANEN